MRSQPTMQISKSVRRTGVFLLIAGALAAAAFVGTSSAKASLVVGLGGPPSGRIDNAGCAWNSCSLFRDSTPPHVAGYAVDPDAGRSSIYVRVAVTWTKVYCVAGYGWTCTQTAQATVASYSSTVLASGYYADLYGTTYGAYHGFYAALPAWTGDYDHEYVSVTALNVGQGYDVKLGYTDYEVPSA